MSVNIVCQTIPAVSFAYLTPEGNSIEVYREGKADKLRLRREAGVFHVYATTAGCQRVGVLGWSRQADAYCVEAFDGTLEAFADTMEEVIGEAGLRWIS